MESIRQSRGAKGRYVRYYALFAPPPLLHPLFDLSYVVFTTGGMPPLVNSPDEVYTRLYERVIARNEAYYAKYPADITRVRRILAYLAGVPTTLPNGGNLTPRRFLGLGMGFGATGGIDGVHCRW